MQEFLPGFRIAQDERICKGIQRTYKVYPAPFGVRLFEQDGDVPEHVDTMVEPDISVICDVAKVNVLDRCFIELSKAFSE